MVDDIVDALWSKLNTTPDLTEAIVSMEVKNAISDLKMKRNYIVTSMSDEDIEKDMENYRSVIYRVAEYRLAKFGAEGEQSHSENGISRYYQDEDSLWKGVHAYVKVL